MKHPNNMTQEEKLAFISNITTKNGLLYRNGEFINLPEADWLAEALGYVYAERLVKELEKQQMEVDHEHS